MNQVQLASIDLNLLVVFQAVLESRHVGKAGQKLALSPSAVSHALGRLRRLLRDPVFLRTPKGVVPTARALELAPAIAEILGQVERVLAASTPFEPATAQRRFLLGMADSSAVVHLPALLAHTRQQAPLVDIGLRQLLPFEALPELEARRIDLALVGLEQIPARFASAPVEGDEFVIVARRGHAFLAAPTLARYCAAQHVLVSASGDQHGFVDDALSKKGLSRRVALTVPSFMLALAALERTDLVSAVPLSLARTHAARFGLEWAPAPVRLRHHPMKIVATRAALEDRGVAWMFAALQQAAGPAPTGPSRTKPARRTRKETPRPSTARQR